MNITKAVIEIQQQANSQKLSLTKDSTDHDITKNFYEAFGLIAAIRYLVPHDIYQNIARTFMHTSLEYVTSLGVRVVNNENA
ncbi:hypothetical protein ABKT97_14490 [Enterobacter hormaechei]